MPSVPEFLYHAAPASIYPLIALSGLLPGKESGLVFMAINRENAVRYAMHRHAQAEPTEFVVLAINAGALDRSLLKRHLLPIGGEVEVNFKYGAVIAAEHLTVCERVFRTKPTISQVVDPLPDDALA